MTIYINKRLLGLEAEKNLALFHVKPAFRLTRQGPEIDFGSVRDAIWGAVEMLNPTREDISSALQSLHPESGAADELLPLVSVLNSRNMINITNIVHL